MARHPIQKIGADMADEADVGNHYMQMAIESAIRYRKPAPPQEGGKCLWCAEELPLERRFCNAECRDDYQKYAL
jgi:hypothetical protein